MAGAYSASSRGSHFARPRSPPERVATIGAFATNVTDYVAADGSNNIAVTADVHDVAGAQAMMASPSPDTAAAMERHGVTPPLTVYIEK
jgi:hypothetical protein